MEVDRGRWWLGESESSPMDGRHRGRARVAGSRVRQPNWSPRSRPTTSRDSLHRQFALTTRVSPTSIRMEEATWPEVQPFFPEAARAHSSSACVSWRRSPRRRSGERRSATGPSRHSRRAAISIASSSFAPWESHPVRDGSSSDTRRDHSRSTRAPTDTCGTRRRSR